MGYINRSLRRVKFKTAVGYVNRRAKQHRAACFSKWFVSRWRFGESKRLKGGRGGGGGGGWAETEGGSITRTRGFGWNDESKSEVSDPMIGKRSPANQQSRRRPRVIGTQRQRQRERERQKTMEISGASTCARSVRANLRREGIEFKATLSVPFRAITSRNWI